MISALEMRRAPICTEALIPDSLICDGFTFVEHQPFQLNSNTSQGCEH